MGAGRQADGEGVRAVSVSPPESSRLRLGVLGVVIVSLFAALFSRLWYLQVMDAATFQATATANSIRIVHTEAPRGRILDSQGRVLVDNRSSLAVTVSRAEFTKNAADVLPRLAALLGVSDIELQRRIDDSRFTPYKPVPVQENVSEGVVLYIKEHQADFAGVDALALADRTYPNGTLAAHLLGYAGEINDTELKARPHGGDNGYRLGDSVGKSGVELAYEDDLRGTPGATKLEVDARGDILHILNTVPPVQGHDVQLTINIDVQRFVEDSLAQGLDVTRRAFDKTTKKNFAAPAGAAVVLDPRDGSVLAMASNPTYDPAAFVNGIKPELFKALQDPASHLPLNDRAIAGLYAPGSTFKLVTAIAALTKGLINPNYSVNDTGSLTVGNRIFYNAGKRAYGPVSLRRALVVSSDVFFYTLGAKFWGPNARGSFGETPIQDTGHQLGLGERTGILLPTEARGRLSTPDIRKRLHDGNPKAFPEGGWFPGDNVNLSIGQGETVVTPLQLGTAYATFANGGTVFQPRVASRVMNQDGSPVHAVAPIATRKVDIPAPVRTPILQGLEGAVADPAGTAHTAFAGFSAFSVAGKTGTAQVVGKQDTAVFCAFAPVENPQYVVAVFMEEAGFGGAAAAPVARRILDGLAGKPLTPVQLAGGVD